jgi:hypothetical protein
MADEVSVFQDANIHVTNLRTVLQGKTYAMANVTSVSTFVQPGNPAPGVIAALIGGAALLIGLFSDDKFGCASIFGALLLVIGICVANAAKNRYWVRIGSASGETNALSSLDRAYIERIVNAMNEAIIRRG